MCVLLPLIHAISALLQTIRYVIVYALDFSNAFDSVRRSACCARQISAV